MTLLTCGSMTAQHPCPALRFLPPRDIVNLPSTSGAIRLGDFSGDGRADLFVLDTRNGLVHLEIQEPDGSFRPTNSLPTNAAFVLESGDLDGDGRANAMLLSGAGPRRVVVRGDRTIALGEAPSFDLRFTLNYPPALTAVADLDGDGREVLLAFENGILWAVQAAGEGGLEAKALASVDVGGPRASVVAGDFNGDGRVDVLVARENYPFHTPLSRILWGDGHRGFAPGPGLFLASLQSAATADFDRDGRMDFAFTAIATLPTSHQALSGIALGDPSAGLRPTYNTLVCCSGGTVAVADFDHDGLSDVVVTGSPGTRVYRGLGNGSLASAPSASVSGSTPVDLDGDGYIDLMGVVNGRVQVSRNACGTTLPDHWVPSVVSVAGVGGARYDTEVTLDNLGASQMALELRYVSTVGGGDGTAVLTLPPHGQRALRPALDALAALGMPIPPTGDRAGALAIRVHEGRASDLVTTARVTTATSSGHAGVSFPGVAPTGFEHGAIVGWLRESAGDRSNVALLNLGGPTEGAITLGIAIVSTDPSAPGTVELPDVTLAPGEFRQVNRILRSAGGATSGYARITRKEGVSPFHAYGIVNDEGTNDGSIVPAFDAARPRSSRFTMPAVVESGRYTSDLVVTNTTDEARTLSFRFVSETLTRFDRTVRFSYEVPARGQVFVPDLVDTLRRQGVDGIGPRGTECVGALFAEIAGEATSGLFLGVRVSAAKPEGRYGVFYQAVPDEALARAICTIPAIRSDGVVRTNVAIVNAAAIPATFTITVNDPARDGARAGQARTMTLEPGRWVQVDGVLSALGTGLGEATVTVVAAPFGPGSPFSNAFLVYGITNDGAAPGAGSDDAAYLAMTAVH